MEESIKNRWTESKKERLMMGIFFLILLFLHLFPRTDWGDDAWYANDTKSLGEHLAYMYRNWTGRLFIEVENKLLTIAPDWIWRILNVLIVLLLVWIVADLFGIKKNHTKGQAQFFFFVLMWSVPMICLMDAGWITTTLNYLWPMTLSVAAARPVRHWAEGEKCPAWEYAVCPLCVLLGANMEQMAALLLGTFLLFGACMIKQKRRLSPFYFILLFLTVASIVFALAAPGNANRAVQEVNTWFPEYAGLNMPQKLLMGFIDTASYYLVAGGIGRNNYIFALLAGIFLAGIWQQRRKKGFVLKAFIALIPFLFCWGGRLGAYWVLSKDLRSEGNVVGLLGLNRCLPVGAGTFQFYGWISYPMNMVLLQAGVYLALLVCVVLTIYFLHGKSYETLFEIVILGAGLLSRLIIGFGPTLYASSERTALCCSLAILAVCLRNLQFFWNGHAEKWNKVLLSIYIAGVIFLNLWGGVIKELLF